jgi:hypothetical protein
MVIHQRDARGELIHVIYHFAAVSTRINKQSNGIRSAPAD